MESRPREYTPQYEVNCASWTAGALLYPPAPAPSSSQGISIAIASDLIIRCCFAPCCRYDPQDILAPSTPAPTPAHTGTLAPTPAPTPAPTGTLAPTPAPTPALTAGCEDDLSFTFRDDVKTCAWAEQKIDPRCNFRAVKKACKATCGLCPGATPAPTSAPGCVDDSSFTFKGNPAKTCGWAALKKTKRCAKTQIETACKATCGLCPGCMDDSSFKFKGNAKKTCVWAAKKTKKRCAKPEIQTACPFTCGTCPA